MAKHKQYAKWAHVQSGSGHLTTIVRTATLSKRILSGGGNRTMATNDKPRP